MMQSFKTVLSLALLAILALASCDDAFETTIDIPPPSHEPQLVISAYNQDNQVITALLTESLPITANATSNEAFVWGAEIAVYRNEEYIGDMEQIGNPGQPVSPFNYLILLPTPLVPGDRYRLEAKYADLPDAVVEATMPAPPPAQSVTYIPNAGLTPAGEEASGFDIRLDDVAGTPSHYEISALNSSDDNPENGFSEYLQSTDPSTSRSLEWNWLLVSDASFDGSDKVVRILTNPLTGKTQGSVFITVASISQAQYEYSRAYRQQLDFGENPFASPVQIPTEVQGGFGFFGLLNRSTFEIAF